MHAICCDEVPPGVGHELLVGRMVDRLYAEDFGLQVGPVLVRMPEKVKLGGAGTDKQNLLSVFERFRDVVEEVLRILGVLPSFARALRVAMHVPRGRMDRGLVERGWMDVKDACFLLIEPDDGVFGHDVTANSKSAHSGAILMQCARTCREIGSSCACLHEPASRRAPKVTSAQPQASWPEGSALHAAEAHSLAPRPACPRKARAVDPRMPIASSLRA